MGPDLHFSLSCHQPPYLVLADGHRYETATYAVPLWAEIYAWVIGRHHRLLHPQKQTIHCGFWVTDWPLFC
jgi:hypothetical protein